MALRLVLTFLLMIFTLLPGRFPAAAASANAAGASQSEAEDAAPEGGISASDFALGAPVFVRIFKESSTLELWLWKQGRFHRYRSYPICKWSGEIGPKLAEGDRQSPEGVYYISGRDLIVNARWHRAMNLGYPNSRDKALGLTGSGILIHGKCSSIGCFALTDPLVEEVYEIIAAALENGQPRIPVHVFPFEMTDANLERHAGEEWHDFWRRLKRAHDLFLRDGLPPRTFVCHGEYAFQSRRTRLVSLAGNKVCTPLRKPAVSVMAAAGAKLPGRSQRALTPQERAQRCNPKSLDCRMLRRALASSVPCPRKYRRCRNKEAAQTKSVDCPLKYPRCRGHSRQRTARSR